MLILCNAAASDRDEQRNYLLTYLLFQQLSCGRMNDDFNSMT